MTQYMEAQSPTLLCWAPWLVSYSLQQAESPWQERGTSPGVFYRSRPPHGRASSRQALALPAPPWVQQFMRCEEVLLNLRLDQQRRLEGKASFWLMLCLRPPSSSWASRLASPVFPRPIRAHRAVQKLLRGAVVKRKVLRGVQRSNSAVLWGQRLLECRGLPKPSQQGVRDSRSLRVLGRGRISAGSAVSIHHSCSNPVPLHDADSPVLLGRVRLIFSPPLLSLFDDTRPFLWIQALCSASSRQIWGKENSVESTRC